VMVLRGAKPGPTFYLGSAFHGDEVNGVEIVAKLAHEIDLRELGGTIIVVPAQNPPALQVQHRYSIGHWSKSPLDQSPGDPWACFPGDPNGNMASLIAHKLYSELMQHADYLVDIHTPTTGGRYAPFAFLPPTRVGSIVEASEKMAKSFGADFVLANRRSRTSANTPGRILHSATQEVTIVNAAAAARARFVQPAVFRMLGGYGRDVWQAGVTGFTGYDHHEGDRHAHCSGRL
jgi:predicted deacylase